MEFYIPAARLSIYSCRSCHPVTKKKIINTAQRSNPQLREDCLPPPTRTMTFFVAVLDSPLAPARLSVVNLHVTVFFANEFENAYCARTSSPSRGIILSGGSTRSINKPCAIELTIAATSASRGSRGLPGVYTYVGFAKLPKSLSRDDGRDGVRCAGDVDDDEASRKLDGGSLVPPDGLTARGLLLALPFPLPLPALILP